MAAEYPVYAARITLTSANNAIRFKEYDSGTPTSALTATIAAGTYYLYGAGTEDGDLCKATQAALEAASGGSHSYAVSFYGDTNNGNPTGKVYILDLTDEVQLITSGTTFPLNIIGFAEGVDIPTGSGSDDSLESTLSPTYTWMPNQPVVRLDRGRSKRPAVMHETSGGQTHVFATGARTARRTDSIRHLAKDRGRLENAPSGDPDRSLEAFLEIIQDGRPVRRYVQELGGSGLTGVLSSSALEGTWVLSEDHVAEMPSIEPQQISGTQIYETTIDWREYMA